MTDRIRILGVSAYYHDSAAVLLEDGVIRAAAQEERFSRRKHDNTLPARAMAYCLDQAGISPADLDAVVFYEKPILRFDRLMETYLAYSPAGFPSFVRAMPSWLKEKLNIPKIFKKALPGYRQPFLFVEHHEAHAASAFFPSPFPRAAIITADGVGEWQTTTIGTGESNRIQMLQEIQFPHSIGLLFSAFTYYLGFKINDGEYKVMGLAPYGQPKYFDAVWNTLMDVRDDGSFFLDQKFFNYCQGLTMTNKAFDRLFDGPPRRPDEPLTQRHMDIAASVQRAVNELMLLLARHARELTGLNDLCLAGGVALNCVANGLIWRERIFDNIWVQPASGDAGGALGAALAVWHRHFDRPQAALPPGHDLQQGSLLGPAYADPDIEAYLASTGAIFERLPDDEALCDQAAEAIAAGRVVGWFQGRMEFGPRALGSRSILADARSTEMQRALNLKIKYRESFRPFAPIVLEEHVADWFEFTDPSPYMLFVAPVKEEHRLPLTPDQLARRGLAMLDVPRSTIPAVTHVDHSARLQTVDRVRFPLLHRLLTAFQGRTGCPVMVNTSFNVKDQPIVCSPHDAYGCFLRTQMDDLFLGRFRLKKEDQRRAVFAPKDMPPLYPSIPVAKT